MRGHDGTLLLLRMLFHPEQGGFNEDRRLMYINPLLQPPIRMEVHPSTPGQTLVAPRPPPLPSALLASSLSQPGGTEPSEH